MDFIGFVNIITQHRFSAYRINVLESIDRWHFAFCLNRVQNASTSSYDNFFPFFVFMVLWRWENFRVLKRIRDFTWKNFLTISNFQRCKLSQKWPRKSMPAKVSALKVVGTKGTWRNTKGTPGRRKNEQN